MKCETYTLFFRRIFAIFKEYGFLMVWKRSGVFGARDDLLRLLCCFFIGQIVHVRPGQQNPQCHLILEYFVKVYIVTVIFSHLFIYFTSTLLSEEGTRMIFQITVYSNKLFIQVAD